MKNWKEELIKAKEDIVFVGYNRGEGATETALKKILNSNANVKPLTTTEVLYLGTGLTEMVRKIESLNSNVKIEKIGYRNIRIRSGSKIINVTMMVNDDNKLQSMGNRFDLGVSDLGSLYIPSGMLSCCKKVVVIFSKDRYGDIKFIDSGEDESLGTQDNKSLLQKEISRLYTELSQMEHSEKTTMTRERLINMIEKLEGLNKNHYSYINDYRDSISMGVGDKNSESQCNIEASGISCEVKSKNCINLNGFAETLREDEDGIEISISKYWYDSLLLKDNLLKRGRLVSLNQEKYIVEEMINPIGKTIDFKLIKVIK